MHIVRIEHSVQSFEKWKHVFDSDPADRKGAGVRKYRIFRLRGDTNQVMIDLEFDTVEKAEAFVQIMEGIWNGPGKGVMQNPRTRIAELVEAKEV